MKLSTAREHRRVFNVQKHRASTLHYDFRLEVDGVFKSWAIPKGPSMDPKVKRLAVQVEDHDLDYADFEGVIGEREYGGGPVLVWDTGWFEPILEGDVTAESLLRKGVLDFVLHGHRLKGRFSLVKIKTKERDWLLIKRHDAEVRPNIDITKEYQTSVLTGRTLEDLKKLAKSRQLQIHLCE
jgi:bifunctional non-homologous end joining protein LigD